MINDLEIYQIFQNRPRIVIFLDNARAHISDFCTRHCRSIEYILLYLSDYSPWFDPLESVWDTHKKYIKGLLIESKEMLVDGSHYVFNEKCRGVSLQKNFKEKYLTQFVK